RSDRAPERLRSARERSIIEQQADGAAFAGENVASMMAQTLAIFELTQLCGCINLDVGIAADAEAPAGRNEPLAVENAVAEVRFGERTEPDDGSRRGKLLRLLRGRMRCVDDAPAWPDPDLLEEPCDRPAAERDEAVVNLFRLLGG